MFFAAATFEGLLVLFFRGSKKKKKYTLLGVSLLYSSREEKTNSNEFYSNLGI